MHNPLRVFTSISFLALLTIATAVITSKRTYATYCSPLDGQTVCTLQMVDL